jgi:hypothetical protein
MDSDDDSELGLDQLVLDDLPDGSFDVIGAVVSINNAGENSHATRAEVERLLGDGEERDYEWVRYRLNQLAEADIVKKNHVHVPEKSTVENRHSITEDYRDDAEKIAKTLSVSGGEIPQDIGVEEFVDLAGGLADARERIDQLETVLSEGDASPDFDATTVSEERLNDVEERLDNHMEAFLLFRNSVSLFSIILEEKIDEDSEFKDQIGMVNKRLDVLNNYLDVD